MYDWTNVSLSHGEHLVFSCCHGLIVTNGGTKQLCLLWFNFVCTETSLPLAQMIRLFQYLDQISKWQITNLSCWLLLLEDQIYLNFSSFCIVNEFLLHFCPTLKVYVFLVSCPGRQVYLRVFPSGNVLLFLSVEGVDIIFKSYHIHFNVVQIRPLVKPTRIILDITDLRYSWHDFVSKSEFTDLVLCICCSYCKLLYIFTYVGFVV